MEKLLNEIKKFREWSSENPKPETERYGEWECDYEEWDSIYSAFELFLANNDFDDWNDVVKHEIIYIIARDNEDENLVYLIAEDESLLFSIAEFAIQEVNIDDDAKWQLAEVLGHVSVERKRAEECVLVFVQDEDEYVSRRALMSLARLDSSYTELYCAKAWESNHEYQRIMALHALYTISSPELKRYLNLAKEDGRKYLLQNANLIEKGEG